MLGTESCVGRASSGGAGSGAARPDRRRADRARRPRRGSSCGRAGCIPAAARRCPARSRTARRAAPASATARSARRPRARRGSAATRSAPSACDEIVRRQADAPFRLRQAERAAHRPVHPRAGLDRRRPGALVQPAQHQQIGALQARFQRAPDGQARMAAEAGPDDLRLAAWRRAAPAIRRRRSRPGRPRPRAVGRGRRPALRPPRPTTACRPSRSSRRRQWWRRAGRQGAACCLPSRPQGPTSRHRADRSDVSTARRSARSPNAGLLDARADRRRCRRRASARAGTCGRAAAPHRAAPRDRRPACRADVSARRAGRPARSRSSTAVDQRAQQRRRRRVGQRRAGRIVDLDVPAPEFGGDAARQFAVGRDQGRRAAFVLQRLAQRQGDDQRLLVRRRAIGARHMLQRGGRAAATRPRWSPPGASTR